MPEKAMFFFRSLALAIALQGAFTCAGAISRRSQVNGVLTLQLGEQWIGNDGPWSTVAIGAGSPAQYANVLVSTVATQPWFVLAEACTSKEPSSCAKSRGSLFDPSASKSWQWKSNNTLLDEQTAGVRPGAVFGFDTIRFSQGGQSMVPTLDKQLLAGIVTKDFYIATLGIRPLPTNLTEKAEPIPNWIVELKKRGAIASLSYGYTAGSYSRFLDTKTGFSHVALGGYDESLFDPHNVTFAFLGLTAGPDLTVGLRSMRLSSTKQDLLTEPVLTLIDAGLPHIWLPEETCDAIAKQFDLEYDKDLDQYLIPDASREKFKTEKANITFTITNNLDGASASSKVDIVLPLSALDLQLTADFPGVSTPTSYFPIRRATNQTQYTLGRAFLQHAYLIADYERRTFSVHQARFPDASASKLRAIPSRAASSSNATATDSASANATGVSNSVVIATTVVGAVVALAFIAFMVWRRRRSRGRAAAQLREKAPKELDADRDSAELDDAAERPAEMDEQRRVAEAAGRPPESLTELPGEGAPRPAEMPERSSVSRAGAAAGDASEQTERSWSIGDDRDCPEKRKSDSDLQAPGPKTCRSASV